MAIQNYGFSFTKADLLEKLGPAPTVGQVAQFLRESPTSTWRKLRDGQLRTIDSKSSRTKVSLESLLAYLNGVEDYQLTYKRGKKPGKQDQN